MPLLAFAGEVHAGAANDPDHDREHERIAQAGDGEFDFGDHGVGQANSRTVVGAAHLHAHAATGRTAEVDHVADARADASRAAVDDDEAAVVGEIGGHPDHAVWQLDTTRRPSVANSPR